MVIGFTRVTKDLQGQTSRTSLRECKDVSSCCTHPVNGCEVPWLEGCNLKDGIALSHGLSFRRSSTRSHELLILLKVGNGGITTEETRALLGVCHCPEKSLLTFCYHESIREVGLPVDSVFLSVISI